MPLITPRRISSMLVCFAASSALAGEPAKDAAPVAQGKAPAALLALTSDDWTVKRVGGDMDAKAVWDDAKGWLYEPKKMRIETPLPEGYPAPTPPGAIELKKYPSVRRAEVTRKDDSANSAFWPLLRHISRNDIAMTAPVEMDYKGLAEAGVEKGKSKAMTMSFLYRTPDLHPVGKDSRDERITIRDTEPVTVLAMGTSGDVDLDDVRSKFKELEAWLAANPQWVRAGDYRTFGYNGPDTRRSRRWVEVQIPVKPAAEPQSTAPQPAATSAPQGQ